MSYQSLPELRSLLFSVLSSNGQGVSEQELSEELIAHKQRLLRVFEVGKRSTEEQKELQSGEVLWHSVFLAAH